MSGRSFGFAIAIAFGATGFALSAGTEAGAAEDKQVELLTPVLVSPIDGNTAAVQASDGRYHVVYELVLTNTTSEPATIDAITILDAGGNREILKLSGADLVGQEAVYALDHEPAPDAVIPPHGLRILLITTSFASPDEVPAGFLHRLDCIGATAFSTDIEPYSTTAGAIDLSGPPPVISPPLEGTGWIAAEGCCNSASHHRNGLVPLNGAIHAGQRFAIDFIQVDEQGRLATGDHGKVGNYVGYGAPVLAAGDGVVIDALDGLPDQQPGIQPDQAGQEVAEITGNHVLIDHENGFFTVYGHLKPGSVVVKPGDRVTAGDEIALVGNTGGSLVPHLHFHVIADPVLSAGNGYPFVFDSYELGGLADVKQLLNVIKGEGTFQSRDQLDPVPHQNDMPLTYSFVDFPSR